MFIFIKRILLYVIILLVVIFIVLGVSSTARDYVFTRAMHSYNLYQLMSLRQDVRNRDFLSAKNKIESQVKISNKLSNSRGQGLVGIEDSLDFVIDKIMFNSQLDMFNPILEDLIKIDSNWYKPRVLLAESIGNMDSDTALDHIDKAIEIIESNDSAYRTGIRISGYNKKYKTAEKYCYKYNNASFGGTSSRTHNGIFVDKSFDKIAISFNEKLNTIFVNSGLVLNEFRDYEFTPKVPVKSGVISLFTGLPPGVRMEISKIFISGDNSIYTLPSNEIKLVSKSSYINENNSDNIELITIGKDDRVDIFLPSYVPKIQKIIFRIKFSKLMLASNSICNSDK